MGRFWLGLIFAGTVLAGPAITMAAFGGAPAPITPTDLRGPALAVKAAVGTWAGNAPRCGQGVPGAVVMYCADGLTSGR